MVPSNSPQVLFLELELSRTWNTLKFMETAKKIIKLVLSKLIVCFFFFRKITLF